MVSIQATAPTSYQLTSLRAFGLEVTITVAIRGHFFKWTKTQSKMAGYYVRKKEASKKGEAHKGEVHHEDQVASLSNVKKVIVRWEDGTKTIVRVENIVCYGLFD